MWLRFFFVKGIIRVLEVKLNAIVLGGATSTASNEEIINESATVANVFNSYLESVTESLDLFNWAPEPYDHAKDSIERNSKFPESLKLSDKIPVYENKDPTGKSNF